ncbi:hypothetical protein D9M68_358500 [compost metagenome]
MATRRKDKKIRDADATKKRLVECVGEIIRNAGFHAIGVNRIAQLAEKDKGVIRYHFGGLSALLRAYIEDRDYWPPFFDRYKMEGMNDQAEVRSTFISLMQENLRQFYNNKEMQKIILWQITQSSSLLRDLSEAREDEGEKLFKLTEETFFRSGISFKAVIAILLGGTYFAVLQSQSIRTRVCGIDLNWERDFRIFNDTLSQIITWAWEKAEEQSKSSNIPMSYELEQLENLVDGLTDGNGGDTQVRKGRFREEIVKVEHRLTSQLLALTNETQIVTFLQFYLPRLVRICDRLYEDNEEKAPLVEMVLALIETIRSSVPQHVPEGLVPPKIFRINEGKKFDFRWSTIVKPLLHKGIQPKLVEIIGLPVTRFGRGSEKIVWYDFKYLKRYLSVLSELCEADFNETMLLETLIGLGLNHSRFAGYLTGKFTDELPNSDFEAKAMLRAKRTRLGQVAVYTQRSFDSRKLPLVQELEKWLDARLESYQKDEIGTNPYKLVSTLKGAELAFWEKLQYDHGIFEENNLDDFSEKIAYNFSTKAKEDLSPTSIKSKFYPKDKLIIRPIEDLLVRMLDDVRKFL